MGATFSDAKNYGVNVPVAIFFLRMITIEIERTLQNNAGTSKRENTIECIEKNKFLKVFTCNSFI